jgi:CRP-like cAMP-binding protein
MAAALFLLTPCALLLLLLLLLCLLLTQRVYEDGDVISRQGDTADDSCYIVAQVRHL